MGGCRCTYRNCTVKSDGKTHFFHYPVFDKVRCHQWLTNAGKFEFLNLKVSQLKNRCICQHHFAEEWFMNSVKDKLKLTAIPTEDGPFCDSSTLISQGLPTETLLPYPLAYEDIENDEYISDRKANYNIKYADFLTNCEETILLNETCKVEGEDNKTIIETVNETQPSNHSKEVLQRLSINSNNTAESCKDTMNKIFTHEVIVEPCPPGPIRILQPVQKKRSKIRIISQKKITEPEKQIPVPVSSAAFETVSPSMILNVNKTRPESQSCIVPSEHNTENVSNLPEMISAINSREFEIKIDLEEMEPSTPAKSLAVEKKVGKPSPEPVQPVVTPATPKKLSAERVAAINAKRQFNMKLKEILEAGLNNFVGEVPHKKDTSIKQNTRVKNNSSIKKNTNIKNNSKQIQSLNETVASSLSKDSSLPSKSDYIISYLESRMNRMENLLLSKIDQNTQRIIELKKTIGPQKESSGSTEKSSNLKGEAHKKQLYKEIQQYLTADTNSMVYEELFINKFQPNPEPELLKKRRRRW